MILLPLNHFREDLPPHNPRALTSNSHLVHVVKAVLGHALTANRKRIGRLHVAIDALGEIDQIWTARCEARTQLRGDVTWVRADDQTRVAGTLGFPLALRNVCIAFENYVLRRVGAEGGPAAVGHWVGGVAALAVEAGEVDEDHAGFDVVGVVEIDPCASWLSGRGFCFVRYLESGEERELLSTVVLTRDQKPPLNFC